MDNKFNKVKSMNNSFLKGFNSKQLEAINSTENKNLVLAGPGTGKTQIVSGIIQKLKNDKISDENIQLITFTNSGVDAIKERIYGAIGKNDISINTFHSFCNNIINDNKEIFEDRIDFSKEYLLDDFDSIFLIKEIYDSEYLNLDKLRSGNKTYYLSFIKSEIGNLKSKGIHLNDYDKYILKNKEEALKNENERIGKTGKPLKPRKSAIDEIDNKFKKLTEFSTIFKKYEERKKELKKVDFNDIILLTIDKLKENDKLIQKYHDKLQNFIVDEYQDTNNNQNKLIELINPEKLYLIGDEKQSIFSFQGANPELILNKEKDIEYNNIILEDNYRSSQNILDFSNNFYNYNLNNSLGINSEVKLNSNIDSNNDIKLITFKNDLDELTGISKKIKSLIQKGDILPEDIAVIYKKNQYGEDISKELTKLGIDFNISLGQNIYENNLINDILYMTNFIFLDKFDNNFTFKKNLYKITNLFESNQEIVDKFFIKIKDIDEKILLSTLNDDKELEYLMLNDEQFKTIINGFKYIIKYKENKSENQTIHEFIKGIQLSNYKFSDKMEKEIQFGNIKLLIEFIKNIEDNGGDYQEVIDKYNLAKNIDYKIGDNKVGNKGVNLLTAHKSKGLEFDTVFVIKHSKGQWDGTRNMNSLSEKKDNTLEEINIQYVAFTRAKKELYISNYLTNKGFNPYIYKYLEDNKPNFVKEISVDKDMNEIDNDENKFSEKSEFYKKLSNEFLKNSHISYSFMNQYFVNPKSIIEKYFLDIKNKDTESTTFGSVIHKLIEQRNVLLKQGKSEIEIKQELKIYYTNKVEDSSLNENEKSDIILKIENFNDNFLYNYETDNLSEIKLKGKIYINDDEDLNVQGYLDAVRLYKEDENNIYIDLIDYKTGALKSSNALMKSDEYNYKGMFAQLHFYKLLINLNLNEIQRKLGTTKNIVINSGKFIYLDKDKGFIEKEIDINNTDEIDIHKDLEILYNNLKNGLF